jgi:formylglycine-generating enzyme required for sulfatase activity
MGSPDNEPERETNQGPRHRVTFSQGFWLADTACTQALWRAVMGANPSHFNDDLRCPVESVSWDRVLVFLTQLNARLIGGEAHLPTEAQWEYACRAETESAFSFGDQINPEQVNYNGDFPYPSGAKGLDRKRPVPGKSLPANAWGLYECHGNVFEWCADGRRDYNDAAQLDPLGPGAPGDAVNRAVRGGPLLLVRRRALHQGLAYRRLGFRFCLKSFQPGPTR